MPGTMPTMSEPPDLDQLLAKDDLEALGLVLVDAQERGSQTLWCDRSVDPAPLIAQAMRSGRSPAAVVIVCRQEVTIVVQHAWRYTRWLRDYLDELASGIRAHGGLQNYLGTIAPNRIVRGN